jgi:hypothetical protein
VAETGIMGIGVNSAMSMDKPNQPYPNAVNSTPSQMPFNIPDFSINGASYDQLLTNRGIRFIHRKAIPCPNITSTEASNHSPDCAFCDDSGYIYYDEKEIFGVFAGNSIEKTFEAHGVWETGTATVTLPTSYADGTQADFNTFDKLTIPDFEVRLYELKEYESRPGNLQDLRYPVKKVEFASSIVNDVQHFYMPGVDFNIDTDGAIAWVPGRTPPVNPNNNKGAVVAWAYFANPVYVVLQSLRELRITQEMVNGVKVAKRLPQQILVRRDFMVGSGEKFAGSTNG